MKKVIISIGVAIVILLIITVMAAYKSVSTLKKNMSGLFNTTRQNIEETQKPVETADATLIVEDSKPQRQVVEINGQEYVVSSMYIRDSIILDTTKADYQGPNKLSGCFIYNGRGGYESYLNMQLDSVNDDYLSHIKIEDTNIYNEKYFVIKSTSEARLNKKRIITTGQVCLHQYEQDLNYFEDIDNDGIEENIPAVIDYVTPVDSIIFWE